MNAAPMCANCTRCSGRTSTLAPASSSRNGLPGTGIISASAGRCTPRARLKVNSEDASAAPVEPPDTSASASPAATAATACTIEDSGVRRTARAGSGSLAIETGASTTETPSATGPICGRGTEQDHADAARGSASSPASDFSGALVGPVDVYRDSDWISDRDRGRGRARARPRARRRTRSSGTRGADAAAGGTAGSRSPSER